MTTKTKVCSECDAEKPLDADHFPANKICKDGFAGQCKECVSKKAKARRLNQKNEIATTRRTSRAIARTPAPPVEKPAAKAPPPPAPPPLSDAAALAILHFEDGVRIGPMVKSATGLQQMPYHVDLSAAQLDELTSWWLSTKKAAAA